MELALASIDSTGKSGVPSAEKFPVFSLVVENPGKDFVAFGQCVLVNNEPGRGIFVTTAHAVDFEKAYKTNECYVQLPHTGGFHRVEISSRWMNWKADLAYLRLADVDLSRYPTAALRTDAFPAGARAQVIKRQLDNKGLQICATKIFNPKISYQGTWGGFVEVFENPYAKYLDRSKRYMRFGNFIAFEFNGNVGAGWSGAALVDANNRLAGIVRGKRLDNSQPRPNMALAISAAEIDFSHVPAVVRTNAALPSARTLSQRALPHYQLD